VYWQQQFFFAFFSLFFFRFEQKSDFGDHFERKLTNSDLGDLEVEKVTSWSPWKLKNNSKFEFSFENYKELILH